MAIYFEAKNQQTQIKRLEVDRFIQKSIHLLVDFNQIRFYPNVKILVFYSRRHLFQEDILFYIIRYFCVCINLAQDSAEPFLHYC